MFYGWSTSMYVRVEENDFLFAKKNNFFVISSYFHDFGVCKDSENARKILIHTSKYARFPKLGCDLNIMNYTIDYQSISHNMDYLWTAL